MLYQKLCYEKISQISTVNSQHMHYVNALGKNLFNKKLFRYVRYAIHDRRLYTTNSKNYLDMCDMQYMTDIYIQPIQRISAYVHKSIVKQLF